jgi:hypothetical protein
MQPRNFVILFAGREGSSAIISMMSAQARVHVPVWEDLDPHRLEGGPDRLLAVMDQVFAEGRWDGARYARNRLAMRARAPVPAGVRHVGFKWRPWGDAGAVAALFRRHRVVVFLLHRRDVVEKAASSYLTFHAMPAAGMAALGDHPQFRLADMGPGERAAALARINGFRAAVDGRRFRGVLRDCLRQKAGQVAFAEALAGAGVTVVPLDHADFAADRVAVVGGMLRRIGSGAAVEDRCGFEKVMQVPAASRLGGLRAALAHPAALVTLWRYRRLLRRIDRIGDAGAGARPEPQGLAGGFHEVDGAAR